MTSSRPAQTHQQRDRQPSLSQLSYDPSNNIPTGPASPSLTHSPRASLTYLPAAVYRPPTAAKGTTLSVSTTFSTSQTSADQLPASIGDASPDPYEFYRYNDPFAAATIGSFQEPIGNITGYQRKSSLSSVKSNGVQQYTPNRFRNSSQYSDSAAAKSTPTLRSQKSSIKDLVARFDHHGEEIPPLPSQTLSRTASRTVSPTLQSRPRKASIPVSRTAEVSGLIVGRGPPSGSLARSRGSTEGTSQSPTGPSLTAGRHRPLFGEVFAFNNSTGIPGYGVLQARCRGGSEGSPMHSPNPMFPRDSDNLNSPASPTAWYLGQAPTLDHVKLHRAPLTKPSNHRRAQSDFSGATFSSPPAAISRTVPMASLGPTTVGDLPGGRDRLGSQSRIPVSKRHQSLASDSGQSSQSSELGSATSRQFPNRAAASKPKVFGTQNSLQSTGPTDTRASGSRPTSRSAQARLTNNSSPRKRPQTPLQAKSTGKRDQKAGAIATAEKSPSLRANIIAPPPKISPPLRSSRPRQPVSMATTSASRAKMVEKFNSMGKQASEARQNPRRPQRPPELNNIDLEGRRRKIAQAINQSVKDNERKSAAAIQSHYRDTSMDIDDLIKTPRIPSRAAPAESLGSRSKITIDIPSGHGDVDEDVFRTPTEQFDCDTQPPKIEVSKIALMVSEADSPTLGDTAVESTENLRIPHQFPDDVPEPLSAVSARTADTEGTTIDNEPQTDAEEAHPNAHSLLSHVMQMRNASPRTPASLNRSDSNSSTRADQESIQIMLRNTLVDDTPQTNSSYEDHHYTPQRDSWTSTLSDHSAVNGFAGPSTRPAYDDKAAGVTHVDDRSSSPTSEGHFQPETPVAETSSPSIEPLAPDHKAFGIITRLLREYPVPINQEHALLDWLFQQVLVHKFELADHHGWKNDLVEGFCLNELASREQSGHSRSSSAVASQQVATAVGSLPSATVRTSRQSGNVHIAPSIVPKHMSFRSTTTQHTEVDHQHYTNLSDGEDLDRSFVHEDWPISGTAEEDSQEEHVTSPSIPPTDTQSTAVNTYQASTVLQSTGEDERRQDKELLSRGLGLSIINSSPSTISLSRSPPPRPPSHSPPPPPIFPRANSIDVVNAPVFSEVAYDSTVNPNVASSTFLPLKVPRRVTSLSKINQKPAEPHQASVRMPETEAHISEERPSIDQQSLNSSSKRSSPSPEHRRLKKRRLVIKELIDTEASFGRDIMVIVDIYKGTADSCTELTPEVQKILFGNCDEVLRFSNNFLDSLKQSAKSVYLIPKSERFQAKKERPLGEGIASAATGTSNVSDDQSSLAGADATDVNADRQTFVGEVFKVHMTEIDQVYSEYLKNHDAANKKLQLLLEMVDKDKANREKSHLKIWLTECKRWASDLTSAWDLNSLLIKPVQRLLKYPLLLQQLIESTPPDHPDYEALREAVRTLTEISVKINETKKHVELVEQGLGRKRKESDVRTGLSKAFGRRTEKLKQHVGLSETVEDHEYNVLRERYSDNLSQLVVTCNDVRHYLKAVTQWVDHLTRFAAAADGWIDVHHSPWPELESKLREFAQTVRKIESLALPEHNAVVQRTVIDPMLMAATMLETLQKDPKRLLQKRDKKLIDYARFKNMRDRGEKLDKRMTEHMEQWEALNKEAKQRMSKLLAITKPLVHSCLHNLVQSHLTWVDIWRKKLPSTMSVSLDDLSQIEKDWQQDFDFQEASALSMSICNGSLLAEAVNMVSFLTPSTTLNGEDSPRQPSWNSGNKRSISLNSESSPALIAESSKRDSGNFSNSPMFDSLTDLARPPFGNGRARTASFASGRGPGTPDIARRNGSLSAQTTSTMARPATSTGRGSDSSQHPPQLNVDTPPYGDLPVIGSPSTRPQSSSTFFSTTAPANHALPSSAGVGVFSSAMPMSDSPRSVDPPAFETPDRDYQILFTVASVYEFNIDRALREAGFPYLTYITGEIFDVIGERGELWLAKNQDDPHQQVGWIWNKHFAKCS